MNYTPAASSSPRHPRRFSLRAFQLVAINVALVFTSAHADERIPLGAEWRYLDDGSDQGTAWRASDFDDSGWESGPAELGFGDGDEATVITRGAITYYFRHTFSADNTGVVDLEVNLRRDDGAIIYLNGSEIVRSNMPSGAVGYRTLAMLAGDDGDFLHRYVVPADSLADGANVLAVEVHQNSSGSSDVSFDLGLQTRDEAAQPSVVRGPYLQMGTPSSMIVRWRTDGRTDTKLSYGRRVGSLSTTIASEGLTQEHEVLITGLDSGTRYFYEIGNADGTFAGNDADHFFKTSPRVGSWEPVRVWVIGDSGECSASQDGCVEAAAVMNEYLDWTAANGERLADIVLMLGDNAYTDATDSETTRGLFEPFAKVLRNHVLWPVPGNHEFGASDSPTQSGPYYEAFTLPKAAEAGGIASGTEAYYSYDYGNIHFVALDSHDTSREAPNNPATNICPGDGSGGAMYSWLCEDLAATNQDFIVSYWHHPPYSKGSHDSDSPSESTMRHMRQRFVPMLEHFGADLNLTGHSHSYERSVLIDGHYGVSALYRRGVHGKDITAGRPSSGGYRKDPGANQGSIYSVVGSSSKNQGGLSRHPIMVYWENIEGSVVLDFAGNQMDAHFIRNDGAVNDRYRLTKNIEEGDQGDTVESEHTGRTASALLGIGPPEIGTIDGADDVDYYRIDLAGSATVTVATAGPTDTRGELLDGSGALIAADSDSGPGGNNFQLTAALEAGVHYVAVSGSEGGYALTALLADAGDQGGTAASSTLLTLYGAAEVESVTAIGSSALLSTVGSIDEAMTDLDYFRIDVPRDGVDVTVRSAGGTDTAGRLLDSALAEIAAEDGGDGNFQIEETLDAGTYYVEVMGETGRYRVLASGSDPDCPWAGEAMAMGDHGGTDETSTLMPIGPPLTGTIADGDDMDVFRIDLAGDATVVFETAGPTDTMGTLRDGAGTELATADTGGPAMNFSIAEELVAGVYYLEVSGAAGSYAVSAQLGGGDSDHGDTAGLSTLLPLYSQDDVDNIKPSALLSTAAEIDAAETDMDVFRLDVPEDMTDVTIRSAGTLDTFAYLRDADGMELAMDDSDGAFRIEATLDAGVYYVEVGGHETGRYRVLAWGDSQVPCACVDERGGDDQNDGDG